MFQNKQFIYRGDECLKLTTIINHLMAEFPAAQIIPNNNPQKEEIKDGDQQCILENIFWNGTKYIDWLQSLKQFFINVSCHILVASLTPQSLTLMALFGCIPYNNFSSMCHVIYL